MGFESDLVGDLFTALFGTIYDWRQDSKIRDATARAEHAQIDAIIAESRASEARRRQHDTGIVLAAMWSIVKEKTGATDEDLHARVGELAASQRQQAASRGQPGRCASCDRPMQRNRNTCVYCGFDAPKAPGVA
jgi:hypothetical protein